jgi:hypothetical protein
LLGKRDRRRQDEEQGQLAHRLKHKSPDRIAVMVLRQMPPYGEPRYR